MKNFFRKFNSTKLALILILALGLSFRLYGLNWDQGHHLHPDERFLTMVETSIKIPETFSDYLNPRVSTLSPYNNNYSFFVYGTFPLNLTKIAGEITGNRSYDTIHLVGRFLSALFDLGVIFFLFKIGQKISNDKVGLMAAFFYSIMVLPIQLSHFFAVDTFTNFFIVLSFYFLILILFERHKIRSVAALGISFGLALACKISAAYFLPIIGLGFLFSWRKTKNFKLFIVCCLLFVISTALAFRLNQPQAFASANFLDWSPNPQFLANLKELKSYSNPESWFPPAVQWKKTLPIIFPLKNLILWGMGLPLGIISIVSVFFTIAQFLNCSTVKKPKTLNTKFIILNTLIVFWILGLFFYQSTQFVKSMRYFLPIYPFLALLSAFFLVNVLKKIKSPLIRYSIFIILLIYPVSFMNIYSHPITRVSASGWIYQNIPSGSVIANEHWDDPLPLHLPGRTPQSFTGEMLPLYDPDTPEKWQKINALLANIDYIILSSNRLYGSIPKVPERYPLTSQYYKNLFSGSFGFEKATEFSSYPCFPPGKHHLFCFNDDSSEEAFTVYDHPKVIIFKKNVR